MHERPLVTAASSASSLAPAAASDGVAHVGLVDGDGGGLDGAAGHLGPDGHVGAQVLDGLEPADRPAELDPALGVLDGQVAGPLGHPDLAARRSARRRRGATRRRPPDRRPARRRAGPGPDQTGVSGSIGRGSGVASEGRRVEALDPGVATGPAARRGRPGARRSPAGRRYPPRPATGRSTRPTTTDPSSAPSTSPAARWEATRGPGQQGPAQLLEDQGGLGQSEARHLRPPRPGTGGRRRPHPVAASPSRSTTRSVDSAAADRLERERALRTAGGCRRPARPGTRRPRSPSSRPQCLPAPWRRSSWPVAPWAARGSARPRCSAGSARCPRRW